MDFLPLPKSQVPRVFLETEVEGEDFRVVGEDEEEEDEEVAVEEEEAKVDNQRMASLCVEEHTGGHC